MAVDTKIVSLIPRFQNWGKAIRISMDDNAEEVENNIVRLQGPQKKTSNRRMETTA